MDNRSREELAAVLSGPGCTVAQKIAAFVRYYNEKAGSDDPAWQVSKEAWQRYEFLGDRILNLAAAGLLFSGNPACDEGTMTQKMGVVANESLAAIAGHKGVDTSLLVPAAIGQQQAYGDAIRGGAIEACIGAISACAGLFTAVSVARDFLAGEIEAYDPSANYIGRLQEHFQQSGRPVPVYAERSRTGPDHQPVFTYSVSDEKGRILGTGTGSSTAEARQNAAKEALGLLHPA
ncbi:putative dsRNA-binding protein [Methanoregula sp. UBA64]|jgi:ribonuclease III|uniref:putative dsRNA-binding protein n=1 Tax=Methanoregula sp. UBA64 TaxID=1915554 RepID=UPI0025F7ABFF|nr:putative dsRNA-binding protein [Methanoregula sp. UBA64]